MGRSRSSNPALVRAVGLALGLGFAMLAPRAEARSGGIAASSCAGCHNGGSAGSLTLASSVATVNPGERVELTLSILGGYEVGGVYVDVGEVGALQSIAGQGLRQVTGGLVHERPKPASGDAVEFRFAWVAPTEPGAVRFYVYALGGNGNNQSTGDAPMDDTFDFVYGCSGKTYYLDGDGDGVGRADFAKLACAEAAAPASFVAESGDCDDYDDSTYPGAPELCNLVDDDCDGQTDEDVAPVELWPDADGDGYYDARTEKVGTPKQGCVGLKGWAALPGDCQPMNQAVNPGVTEICNYLDDDCDGDVDERVRPTCGVGWCRRESPSCDAQDCRPGDPTPEKCNLLDDDCDGEVDEDAELCPSGQSCTSGACAAGSGGAGAMPTGGAAGTAPATGGASAGIPPTSAGASSAERGSAGCALGAGRRHGALAALLLIVGAGAGAGRRRRGRRAR